MGTREECKENIKCGTTIAENSFTHLFRWNTPRPLKDATVVLADTAIVHEKKEHTSKIVVPVLTVLTVSTEQRVGSNSSIVIVIPGMCQFRLDYSRDRSLRESQVERIDGLYSKERRWVIQCDTFSKMDPWVGEWTWSKSRSLRAEQAYETRSLVIIFQSNNKWVLNWYCFTMPLSFRSLLIRRTLAWFAPFVFL